MFPVQVPHVRAKNLLEDEEHVRQLIVLIVSRRQHLEHLDDSADRSLVNEARVERLQRGQVVLPEVHAGLQSAPVVLVLHILDILKALLRYSLQLLSFKVKPLVVLVAEFNIHLLLIRKDQVVSRWHSDCSHGVRD